MTVIGMGRVIMGLSAGAAFFRICTTDPGCRASRHRPREEGRVLSVENETILHASPPRVWTALTRFDNYGRWSPFIRIDGALVLDGLVAYSFRLNSKKRFRSEEHTSALQSLMRISYAVFCLKKKTNNNHS